MQGDPKVTPSTSWVGGAGGRASRPILTGTLRGTQPWGSSLKQSRGRGSFRCKKKWHQDFPGGPEAKTPGSQSRGPRFNPCLGS